MTKSEDNEDNMTTQIIPVTAFTDQRPGTAGLRKKVAVVRQPHYLASFV